jgi:hypothetical protein
LLAQPEYPVASDTVIAPLPRPQLPQKAQTMPDTPRRDISQNIFKMDGNHIGVLLGKQCLVIVPPDGMRISSKKPDRRWRLTTGRCSGERSMVHAVTARFINRLSWAGAPDASDAAGARRDLVFLI